MAFDYAKAAATAKRLLVKFGQTGVIPRTESEPPANEWEPPVETTVEHEVTAAVLPIHERDVDGTLIKAGDQQIIIAAEGLTIEPTTTDRVILGGEIWTLTSIKPLAPGGITVIYDCIGSR